jgi:diaminopimelate epimerase
VSDGIPFAKGHGTQNDFVVLPDPEGALDLTPERVAALCDRRRGLGADGVLRVVRWAALGPGPEPEPQVEWFMDYRNADGSLAEMCGNGIRVFVRYLVDHQGVDPSRPIPIGTRTGVLTVTPDPGGATFTVDMGEPRVLGETKVSVGPAAWPATHVSMGNPHAVAFVDSLDPAGEVGPLHDPPGHDPAVYPDGVNVEFVVRRGPQHVAMRVHERGSGETRSCGTGACAVMVATALADGAERNTPYRVDVPGGTLHVTWTDPATGGRVLMTGPAVIVAAGNWLVPPTTDVRT